MYIVSIVNSTEGGGYSDHSALLLRYMYIACIVNGTEGGGYSDHSAFLL